MAQANSDPACGPPAVIMNINARNVQIGDKNVLLDKAKPSDGSTKGSTEDVGHADKRGTILTEPTTQQPEYIHIQHFRESVNEFGDKSLYILITGKIGQVMHLNSLSYVPWIAVFDFDPDSWSTGLLSHVKGSLSKIRSLHLTNWQDAGKGSITERSTSWVFMQGFSGRPNTLTPNDFSKWKRLTKKTLELQFQQLKKLCQGYADPIALVLWPADNNLAEHVKFVVDILDEIFEPNSYSVVIVDDCSEKSESSKSALTLLRNNEAVTVIELSFAKVCQVADSLLKSFQTDDKFTYKLPTGDSLNDPQITPDKAQWLSEDLEVIYINNMTGFDYDIEHLKSEEDTFYRGGTLSWPWWYKMGPAVVDVPRDILKDIIKFIESHHLKVARSGRVTLLHAPGSGGTSFAQRVLWHFKDMYPCAAIKTRSGSTVNEVVDKIEYLGEKTRMPMLVLVDGEEEQLIDSIEQLLRQRFCITFLYVKRNIQESDVDKNRKGIFQLKSTLTIEEAQMFGFHLVKHCKTNEQKSNVEQLVKEVENGESHSVFEFGLAVHSYEYKGIRSYVKGYLQLDEEDPRNIQSWQTALAFLSLVYYYGQSSVPCYCVSKFLKSTKKVLKYEDFPDEMKELVVKEVSNGKRMQVRISHHYVAKEILEQMLTKGKTEKVFSKGLSPKAKLNLGQFAVEFIKMAGEIDSIGSLMCTIISKTFIVRDKRASIENEKSEPKVKQQKFALLLEDASHTAPYTERFSILHQLTKSFPSNAQFNAHLGRLYSLCKADEELTADKCFKDALELALRDVRDMDITDVPYNSKCDLKHIFHMYGHALSVRINRYIGELKTKRKKELQKVSQMFDIVEKACKNFENCRVYTPIGCEECFAYLDEIKVSLKFLQFIKRNVQNELNTNLPDINKFREFRLVIIDELFTECLSFTEPEPRDKECIATCIEMFQEVFRTLPCRLKTNRLQSRRQYIASIKIQFGTETTFGTLESVQDPQLIKLIAKRYEENFNEYDSQQPLISKRALDLDYREWMCAIRHKLFDEIYSLEQVLKMVENWNELLHSQYSRFYKFVLKSLLGFGSSTCPGNKDLLVEAQSIKHEMIKESKFVFRPKYPREWLGKDLHGTNIRRLACGKRFFNGPISNEDSEFLDHEIMKGTIESPNNKPAEGYISLDLGLNNTIPVKVFYVPAIAEMQGTYNANARVQFQMGFSMSHGYEAYNVKRIGHVNCRNCQIEVEARSCDTSVDCPSCHSQTHVKMKPQNSQKFSN